MWGAVRTSVARAFYLTKSDFLRHQVCPAWAWVALHAPERLPPPDPIAQRTQERGAEVEALARDLFPGAIRIEGRSPADAARRTEEAARNGAQVLLGATVQTPFGLMAEANYLVREGRGWHLYEVRGTTASRSDPRKIQKRFLDDIGFQVHAFGDAGYEITAASVIHLNNTYRRNGQVRTDQLFQITEMTPEIHGVYATVGRAIEQALAALADIATEPECGCHLKAKYNRCEPFAIFHPEFPEKNSVLELRVGKEKLQQALALGVTSLLEWPEHLPLTDRQQELVRFRRAGEGRVDVAKLRAILGSYRFPLHFYDYETFAAPMPPVPGVTPFEAVPFQYSLHIVQEDGTVQHREFLWTERGSDPVPVLAAQLTEDVGPTGTMIAWNAGYERTCNTRMAERYPEFRHAMADFNARTVDLGDIIKQEAWLHPEFYGSWSLKNVLPVAAPDLDYRLLEIGEGGTASERWMQAVLDPAQLMDDAERERIFAALRTYCHLDTLAMVRIWQHAHHLCGTEVSLRYR